MENNMRKSRLKITKDNFDSYKLLITSLPKHQKGNSLIRESLNISEGTWSYIRQSDTYAEFAKRSSAAHSKKTVLKKGTVHKWQGTYGSQTVPSVPFQPQTILTPSSVAGELHNELHNINKTLIRLCVAIESKKKGWL